MSNQLNRRQFLTLTRLTACGIVVQDLVGSAVLAGNEPTPTGTFSIVAYDADAAAWGIAITSRALAAGRFMFAKADAGAIISQSLPDIQAANTALDLLVDGQDAQMVLDATIDADSTDGQLLEPLRQAVQAQFGMEMEAMRDIRQIGVVDAGGQAVAFTGAATIPWSGHIVGDGFTCQGNSLAGEAVVTAMADTFTATPGDLADRLLAALQAGQAAGGDTRVTNQRNSAGLLVVKLASSQFGVHDRLIDLRVDHADAPLDQLEQLRTMHRADFGI